MFSWQAGAMHKAIEPRFQRAVSRWLYFATAACLIAPLSIPLLGKESAPLILGLPMVVCLGFWLALTVQGWAWRPNGLDEHSRYIKENHPEIWRKLHPNSDFTSNTFTNYCFALGHYDDGSDPRLNGIKSGMKRLNRLVIWPFLLIPATWAIWLLIYFSCYPVHWAKVAN